jgi:hypothetical protein
MRLKKKFFQGEDPVLGPDELIGWLQYATEFEREGKGVGILIKDTMPALI